MKRALSMILATVLLLSFAGCSTANEPSASPAEPEEEEKLFTLNEPSASPAEPEEEEKLFTFRGVSFNSTKAEIKEAEEKIDFEGPHGLRIDNINLQVPYKNEIPYLFYYFEDEGDDALLTYIQYRVYGDFSRATDASRYETVNSLFIEKYGMPLYTNSDYERPVFNKLEGNTASLIEGPAYKESDFAGSLPYFSEWLFESGEYWVDVVVYVKHYPAHWYNETSVMYTKVPGTLIDGIVDSYNEARDNI